MAFSNNLLKFADQASTNIQEAFGKQSKKRRVNVRKYVQKRVKRLDSGCKGPKLPAHATFTTKSKSARCKPVLASRSCPEFSSLSHFVPQSTGETTRSQSTLEHHSFYDPELDSLLSDIIELESTHSNSPSASRSASVSPTPSQPTLEAQVIVAEQPFSPYSSCSEDYNGCSPVPASLPAWNSPPTTQLPYTTGYNYTWEEQPISTGCAWIPPFRSTPAVTTSVCNHDPLMTPIVSELLDQYNY